MIPPGYIVLANGTVIGRKGKPLKGHVNAQGYRTVGVKIQGSTRNFTVHVWVCETFHGPKPFPEAQVRHLDGNPLNNDAHNLKWGTAAENVADMHEHGTHARGERHGHAKLTEQQVREIRARYAAGGVFYRQLAAEYGVTESRIGTLIRGKGWAEVPGAPGTGFGSNRRWNTAKLTAEQVQEIRGRADESHAALAREYGVSRYAIYAVITRRSWADL
jgi:hypothetical protein